MQNENPTFGNETPVAAEAVENLISDKEECISRMIDTLNVSPEEAESMMKAAEERLGMSPELYAKYDFFQVPESMQEELFEKIKLAEQQQLEKAEAQREKEEKYETEIAEKTGWDMDQVKNELRKIKKRLGVTIDEYFRNKYYDMSEDAQDKHYNKILAARKKSRRTQETKQLDEKTKAVNAIFLQTGMPKSEIDKELVDDLTVLDLTPTQYLNYRVFAVDKEERMAWGAEVQRLEQQKSARLKRTRQGVIARAALHLGISEKEAETKLSAITKAYKLTFAEAVKHQFYSLPQAEKKAAAAKILKERTETTRGYGKKYIHDLAVDLGCSDARADAILKEAKSRLGITSYLYTLYRFQDIPVMKQAARYREVLVEEEDKKERLDLARAGRIERLALRSGWSLVESEQAMIDAFNRSGISFVEYLQNDFFLLSAEEQDALHLELEQEREEQQAKERAACIAATMEYKGCTAEEAEEMLADAERRLKLNAQTYRRYKFYTVPVLDQWERYQEIKGQLSDRTQSQIDDYESYLAKIIDATGWTKEEALDRVRQAKKNCGASWKDFYAFKFWNLTEEEQKEYFTSELSLSLGKKYDDLRSRDIFVNKEAFLDKFKEYLGRGWVVSNKVTYQEFVETFKDTKKILYKPSNNGNSGSGIEVFDLTEGFEEAYNRISTLPRGIVEGYLVQHEEMSRLYPYSVNTIRVASICHDGTVEIPYAILRVGANKSFVDNFTTGGMVADMDLETGKAKTDAVDVHGNLFELHPDTLVPVKGFEIPYFKEGLDMVRRAGHDVNGYIGWDVAITENGPVLIEGNVDPGNRLLSMPHIPERKGMAYVMRKFL